MLIADHHVVTFLSDKSSILLATKPQELGRHTIHTSINYSILCHIALEFISTQLDGGLAVPVIESNHKQAMKTIKTNIFPVPFNTF